MMQTRKQTGFTLIEVMVVVVILGILAAAVVPSIMKKPEEARISRAKQDVKSLESALNTYRLDNYDYPSTEQGLAALVQKPGGEPAADHWKGPYLKKVPKDPWGRQYQYMNPGVHGSIDIFSFGKDKNSPDDDIGNWNLDEDITAH